MAKPTKREVKLLTRTKKEIDALEKQVEELKAEIELNKVDEGDSKEAPDKDMSGKEANDIYDVFFGSNEVKGEKE